MVFEKGVDEALSCAFAYVKAGADGIMIHGRKKEPNEIFEFAEKFRKQDSMTPLAVVPAFLNSVTEEEFQKHGFTIVIYENHLIRSAFPAMMETAKCILENHRAKEAEDKLLPIKDVITSIPEKTYAHPGRGGITGNSIPQITGYLSGTFDLFHIGHLNLLRRAKSFCDRLIVGVHESGARKGKATFIPLEERMKIVAACRYVDEVIPAPAEDSDAWESHHFQRLFVGSDYLGSERFQRYMKYFEN